MRCDAPIVANEAVGDGNHRLIVEAEGFEGWRPGQFLMISAGPISDVVRHDPLLPRPMAIYRSRPTGSGLEVEILYKVTGRGTRLLAEAQPGERVRLVGPLGQGFSAPAADVHAILVGGGTGIASLYELAVCSIERGPVTVILGARSANALMAVEDFEKLDLELRICTEDGSRGERGLVTDVLSAILADRGARAIVHACGPTAMMRRCAEIAAAGGVECQVSLENGMACGFGVCLGCAVPLSEGGYALVCRRGPVFEAGELDWEGLP